MTIIEALATKKPFRRKSAGSLWQDPNITLMQLTRDELLAGDWEVSQGTMTVNLEDYKAMADELQAVRAELYSVRAAANAGKVDA